VDLRQAVLVIDEVGYTQLNRQEAELFFRLISQRYGHGSVILTSNKYFSEWGELRSDTVLATAAPCPCTERPRRDLPFEEQTQNRSPNRTAGRHSGGQLTGDCYPAVVLPAFVIPALASILPRRFTLFFSRR
jgi:hypothetical protein